MITAATARATAAYPHGHIDSSSASARYACRNRHATVTTATADTLRNNTSRKIACRIHAPRVSCKCNRATLTAYTASAAQPHVYPDRSLTCGA